MPKYFVNPEDIDVKNRRVALCGENAKHLITTLRVRCGDQIVVCDGQCIDYYCEIAEISSGKNKQCILTIISEHPVLEPQLDITLYQALPKSNKMEYIIQKCVEMGIYSIVPIYTDNSSIKEISQSKMTRYRKISEAAAKQSMRGFIPHISEPLALEQAITASAQKALVFAPYENERQVSLKDLLLKNDLARISSAAFFIGSEGGFSDREIDMLTRANISRISLGARILRTETAGFAILTILMYLGNELSLNRSERDR